MSEKAQKKFYKIVAKNPRLVFISRGGEKEEYKVHSMSKILPILQVCENDGIRLYGFGRLIIIEGGPVEAYCTCVARPDGGEHRLADEVIEKELPAIIDFSDVGRPIAPVYGAKVQIDGFIVYWASGVKSYGWGLIYEPLLISEVKEEPVIALGVEDAQGMPESSVKRDIHIGVLAPRNPLWKVKLEYEEEKVYIDEDEYNKLLPMFPH